MDRRRCRGFGWWLFPFAQMICTCFDQNGVVRERVECADTANCTRCCNDLGYSAGVEILTSQKATAPRQQSWIEKNWLIVGGAVVIGAAFFLISRIR
jgi:hypothetical protein